MEAYNFCAGPAMIDPRALARVQADLANQPHLGASLLEISHRTPAYAEIHARVLKNLHTLFNVGDDTTLFLLQGGASGQFAMLPYNFLREGDTANYLVRGYWGEKAAQQASRIARIHMIEDPEEADPSARYLHITTNETIAGTRLPESLPLPDLPLCADMSSDILAVPRNYNRFDCFYAGAQKNLGTAGLAVVAFKKEFLSQARRNLPGAFCYLEHNKANGLYHTPNLFAILLLRHVTDLLLEDGLNTLYTRNARKAETLYKELDRTPFWRALAPIGERSLTNVTWRLPTVALEEEFLEKAEAAGLHALRGHRSAGGIRASLYNALPEAAVDALVAFMRDFERTRG